jgi:hyperosmotically inducible protein
MLWGKSFVALSAAVVVFATAGSAAPRLARDLDRTGAQLVTSRLAEQVRHELIMLPYLGVFDNLQFELKDNGEVVLLGSVVRPTLKVDAESAVRRVEGVQKVVDEVKVLPVSFSDDRIRIATYYALFGSAQLNRYALQAVPPIHIIVRNGNVSLEGIVASQMDKNIAGLLANGVPGVFSVANELNVEK